MMKQQPEHFELHEQEIHSAPETLIPNVLTQLGLNVTRKHKESSSASLLTSVQANDWQTRLAALEALHHQNAPIPHELLFHALHDEDASVRASAVRSLGKRDDSIATAELETALHDPDWHVRETAVLVLGEQVSPPIHLLELAQNDKDSMVREAATSMLRDRQTEDFTIRSLAPDELLQARSTMHFSRVIGYKNTIVWYIQGVRDKIAPRQSTQSGGFFENMTQHSGKGKQRQVMQVLEGVVAAIVVLGLVGSWFALTRGVHTSTQGYTGRTLSNKGTVLYHQDEMAPIANWTSNSKYVYIYDKQNTLLHFINVVTKQVTTIANPDLVAQHTTGKLATLTPDGLSICTVDNTGSALHIQIQSVLTNKILFNASYPKIVNTSTGIFSQWSNDGTRIALSSDNGIITIANVTLVQPLVVLKGVTTPANTLEWSHDDRLLLATTANGSMQAWNTVTGQRSFVVTVRSDTVGSYLQALSPDGKRVAIIPDYQSIQILDATTGKVMLTHHNVMSSQNAYYQWIDSTHIISTNGIVTSNTQRVQIWDVVSGHVTLDIPLNVGDGYSTSSTNKYIVTQSPNPTTFQVWDATTGRKVATHTSSSTYLPFSSLNEQYFITLSGGSDNKIEVWSATTGKTVATYYGSDNSVIIAQWSPDGKYLLSLSTNGRSNPVGATLDLWQAPR